MSSDIESKRTRRKHKRSAAGFDTTRRERSNFAEKGAISSREIADFYWFLKTYK